MRFILALAIPITAITMAIASTYPDADAANISTAMFFGVLLTLSLVNLCHSWRPHDR